MGKEYERHEAEEILRRALAGDETGQISHEDLLAAAAEVGLDPAKVELAAQEWQQAKREQLQRNKILKRRRSGFVRHLLSFAGVLTVLALPTLLADASHLFFSIPGLLWSIPLILHGISTFLPSEAGLERQVQRELRLAERREERRAAAKARPSGQPQPSSLKVEHVVERVLELLALLLRRLFDQLSSQGQRPNAPKPPRVRVEPQPPPPSAHREPHSSRSPTERQQQRNTKRDP